MNTIEWTYPLRFGVALALGFLIGLERESTKIEQQKLVFGGVRTHPIISMYGFGCAWLHQIGVTFMIPAGLLSVSVLTAIAYVAKIKGERFGSTSEMSALLTFIMGALALLVDVWVAMALGVVNAILLSEKARLEAFVEGLNKAEFLATLKFLVVTVIILPVLPDQEYSRFKLNPAHIWQIVVLVSTIGFIGYYLSKKFGNKVGLWLSGLLGGIVSSTAVTVAAGRLAQSHPERASSALQGAILSASVMYIRMLILIAVVNPLLVPLIWWKVAILSAIGVGLAVRLDHSTETADVKEVPGLQNPFEITPAIMFAALYVVLLVVTEVVKTSVGIEGILALSVVVGVSDITPFVLSLIHSADAIHAATITAILIAMMSNMVARGVYFWFLAKTVRRQTAWRYILWSLLHLPLIFFT